MSSPVNTKKSYYSDAKSWAEDTAAGLKRSRTTAWIIAGVAALVAVCEAFALAALAPLKTVEPYTLLVDRQTGYTQMLRGDGADRVTADEALTQSLLAQYVIAREGFDITTLRNDYRKVALWSAGAARSQYVARMQTGNPQGPLTTLPRSSIIAVHIKSVSRLSASTALVRFDTERLDMGQSEGTAEPFVAVIRYQFATAPMSIDDRLINPLGFQVTSYRVDQEAATPAASAPPQPSVVSSNRPPAPAAIRPR